MQILNRGWMIAAFLALLSAAWTLADELQVDSLSLRTFDEVWETIYESYFDPEFGGLDWEGMREKYRPEAAQATDAETLRPVLNKMLGELGESHFGVIPSSDDLEESAVIEASVAESDGQPVSEEPETVDGNEDEVEDEEVLAEAGDYSGIHLRMLDDQVVICRVDEGSPAAQAGLKAGTTVKRIGKLDVEMLVKKAAEASSGSFSKDFFILEALGGLTGLPEEGEEQSIAVVSPRGKGKESVFTYRPIRYPGEMSAALANMPRVPLRFEERRLPLPQGDMLVLEFNIFLPELMDKLRQSIRKGVADGIVGLVVDLRGNPGGIGMMANGLAGLLTEEQFSLGQMKMRAGEINFVAFPQKNAYLGPVAVLVDGMSASTSEIFAAGMQEAGRARVFGRRTMGAALPSFIRTLPNGDRLQHAIADLTTAGGRRVEGNGVIPDVTVGLHPKKRFRGADPDLDRALKWLKRQASKDATKPEPAPLNEPTP